MEPRPSPMDVVRRVAARLIGVQLRHPWRPILACAALAVLGAVLATRLELRTRFDQLLPDHEPSVVELRRVEQRVTASQNVFVVLEGGDVATLRAMGDALAPRLRALGPPWVTHAEDGAHDARAFLAPRAAMFLDPARLQKLADDIEARWDWQVRRETGIDLDDEEPPPITAAAMRARFGVAADDERYPDGYYQSRDGRALVVVAGSATSAGDLGRAREALERVKAVVREVSSAPAFAQVRVGYAGDLVTGLSEYSAVMDDLVHVGVLGVGLVLAVVLLFFMRLRVLVAMGLTMAAGLALTFGLTQLAIGHLNAATGFLVSIVAGNGINFGIIYMARFYEELRAGASPDDALIRAHRATWPATLTAAVAAAASYGSLGVTDFRAFKHFAFIGGVGMLVCWAVTYAMLPAVLVLLERARPFVRAGAPATGSWARLRLRGLRYDRPFAWIAARAPRSVALGGAALAAVGFVLLVPYLRADPMEYNMRRLQNDLGGSGEMYRVSALAADVLGAKLESSMAVLCDSTAQVRELKAALLARRDAAPAGEKPFEAVHTLLDFVPPEQARTIPVALELRARLLRARERGLIAPGDWAAIEPIVPPAEVAPWTLADLPEDLARPFTEKDGARGRLVLIEPTAGKNDSDLRYLLRWASSFRETRLPDGSIVRGSGRAVIFADMLAAVEKDMPRAIALSLGMTALAVVVTFRRGSRSLAVLGALLAGLGWIAVAMAAGRIKINFFNFIALPITFGIGVDYAVNFVQRYAEEGRKSILGVLRATGGPVILCSLTTTLGYLALIGSVNQAIRSLGLLAVLGEVACLLAATLVLPAALLWREQAARARASSVVDPSVLSERAS